MESANTPRGGDAVRARPLEQAFFDRPADRVARDLLGTWLVVRDHRGRTTRHLVRETEAYLGAHDLACHGRTGPTKRNATMFGPAGRWYVYLCYGLHWMLNVVTGPAGVPAAVLIRGAGDLSGPGRVTRALAIDRRFDGRPASRPGGLWFEAGDVAIPRRLVRRTPRIGVGYAGEWAEKPLRFLVDPARLTTIASSRRRPE
ncbi:MAG: DNA-3-methyladenine glycosylase [Planctomycetia bacterium]|nr:DNA-3-methyladenine glycosylase [Planctomycetia bacterium]